MADEAKKAPTAGEVIADATAKAPDVVTPTPKEATVGEALNTAPPKVEKEAGKMVPEAVLIQFKKENKELAKQLKDLQTSIADGATKKEVTKDIKALAEKHGVDPEFLEEVVATVRANAKEEADAATDEKLKPFQEEKRQKAIDEAFGSHFSNAMAGLPPEFAKVVNKEVIKQLSLNPANVDKTFTKIIEDTYGHLVTGKRTMDSPRARGGKDDGAEIDFSRANTDKAYFNEIMSDPVTKKKYNDSLTGRIASHL